MIYDLGFGIYDLGFEDLVSSPKIGLHFKNLKKHDKKSENNKTVQ